MKTKKSLKILSFATKTSQKNLSKSQRNAIRDAFVDYFWECVENE